MIGFLGSLYPWVKAAHVIFVIFMMAGLFMMPRFFIYHQECDVGSNEEAKWLSRENKLRKIILNPSLILVWILGLALAAHLHIWDQWWFIAKLVFVLLLSGYHGWVVGYYKKLSRGERSLSDKKLRLYNEVPGIMVSIVVILVIVRPF